MCTPLRSICLLSVLVFFTHFGSGLLPSLFAHNRQIPPTPAEVAWSRTAAIVEKLRNDPRAYLPPRPPAPAGVTDLEFNEFFVPIVGDRGLELTDKIRALHGQRVRLLGFMVRQAQGMASVPGSEGDYAWAGAGGTFFWIDPKEQVIGLLMAQTPGPQRQYYRRMVKQLIYQAME